MNRRQTIGFDRRIALDWLEATASRVAAGDSLEDLRAGMWQYLEGKVSGDKFNSDRGKTMTVLSRIWGKVPPAVDPLQTRAVAAFQTSKALRRPRSRRKRTGVSASTFSKGISTGEGSGLAAHGYRADLA